MTNLGFPVLFVLIRSYPGLSSKESPPSRPPDPPPEELEIEGNRPQAGLEGSQGTLCSLFASSLLFFVLLASFGTILVLF